MDEDSTENSNKSRLEYNAVRLIGVEYPGVVQNPSHVIETLGGEDAISRVFSEPSRRLAMTFRPRDPFSKAICGDRQPSTNLLLRVRRRKKREESRELSGEAFEYKQEILGVVDTTYRFDSMADYQYLSSEVKDPLARIHGLDLLEEDTSMHILPPMFSRLEKPSHYHFKPDLQPPSQPEEEQAKDFVPKMRIRQPVYALAISHDTEEIPTKPHEKASQVVALVKDNQVEAIKKLFNVRPIWSRMALQVHMSNVKFGRLKQLLSVVAFYYLNGPWRTLWVKFGYDPRKDPGSKIYQLLDFRLGARREGKKLPIPRKRGFSRFSIPVFKKNAYQRQVDLGRGQVEEQGGEDEQNDDLPYVFTANKLPSHKQVFYQLCDLHIGEIQDLISANDGQETECLEKEGWCLPGTLDKIRDILVKCSVKLVQKNKSQQSHDAVDAPDVAPIQWGEHTEIKGFLEMLEDDDDVETYDVFGDEDDASPKGVEPQ